MATFKVGEIAVTQNLKMPFAHMNGEDVEILEPLAVRLAKDIYGKKAFINCYVVLFRGDRGAVLPEHLRKKIPPSKVIDADFGKLVGWDECAWNPMETV